MDEPSGAAAEVQALRARLAALEHREAVLRQRDEQLRLVLEHIHEIVYQLDLPEQSVLHGRPTFVGPNVAEILGHPPEAFVEDPELWARLIHPDDRAQVTATTLAIFASGRPGVREYRLRHGRTDEYRWIEDRIVPQLDPAGRVTRVFGVARDVTLRKQLEGRRTLQFAVTAVLAEAATLEEAIRRLLETVCLTLDWDLGEMWLVDRDAQRLRWGGTWWSGGLDAVEFEAASRTLTFRPGEGLPGRIWAGGQSDWIADVVRDPDFVRATLAAREGLHGAFGFPIRADGEVTGVMVFLTREVRPPDPEALKLVTDIGAQIRQFAVRKRTEEALRRSEEQLRRAQRMEAIGRLAGGIAHDFNNLLAVILGHADMLVDIVREGDPSRDSVLQVREAAARAAGLTRQLLALGRRQVLARRVLDVSAVVQGMRGILARLIREDIELRFHLAPGLGAVRADASQLEQVVMNLVVNAVDAMPEGGSLTIETRGVHLDEAFVAAHPGSQPGPHVCLEVRDTGIGMDAATLSYIFEPFFTTKEPGVGTGLGLATVYGIVKQHTGYIAVSSTPGAGTAFEVYLPVHDAPTREAAPSRAGPVPRGTETVLLVEDEAWVRTLVRDLLLVHGYRVVEARDPVEALALFDQDPGAFQLLLTDVVMPRMRGPELARRLVARRPELRVLYISGYPDAVFRPGELDPGTTLLSKPFSSEDLARAVRQVLDRPLGSGPAPSPSR